MRLCRDKVGLGSLPMLVVLGVHLGPCLPFGQSSALAADGSGERSRPASLVSLQRPHAAVRRSADTSRLQVDVTVRNRLGVALRAVHVGVLFAPQKAALTADVEPSALYRRLRADEQSRTAHADADIVVVQNILPVRVPAGQRRDASFEITLPAEAPSVRAFRTHVLSYAMAAPNAETLFELLETPTAADAVAAVEHFAMLGTAAQKLEIRRAHGPAPSTLPALLDVVAEPRTRPNVEHTRRFVYAATALAVLGGGRAVEALKRAQRNDALAAYDAPLRVLRLAKIGSTALQAPLAHTLPTGARHMREIVAAALRKLEQLEQRPTRVDQPTAGEAEGSRPAPVLPTNATRGGPAKSRPDAGRQAAETTHSQAPETERWRIWMMAIVAVLLLAAAAWLWWQGRGR